MRWSVLLLLCAALGAGAERYSEPQSGVDPRLRTIVYTTDVIRLDTRVGIVTQVVFAPAERVKGVYLGDKDGWSAVASDNVLFVKPKGELADTNLVVKTDRRTYNFWLAQVRKGEPETFQLIFSYPADEAEARRLAAERKEREEAAKVAALTPKADPVETVRQSFEAARAARPKNMQYSAQGASTITPVAAYDDGLFTYFTFNPGGDLPALFVVNNDNSEAIADFHVEDSQIVVHRVSPKFILRRGNDVACIWNDAFDPRGEPNPTRTISPDVERVIKPAR